MMRIVQVTIPYATLTAIGDSVFKPGDNCKALEVETQARCLVITLNAPLADGTTRLSLPLEHVREIRWAPEAEQPKAQIPLQNKGPKR